MTKDDEKYYAELFEMFATPGWNHYGAYIQKVLHTQQVHGWQLPNADLEVNKGIVTNLEALSHFQEEHEQAYEQLNQDEETHE